MESHRRTSLTCKVLKHNRLCPSVTFGDLPCNLLILGGLMVRDQEVEGSNPSAPTITLRLCAKNGGTPKSQTIIKQRARPSSCVCPIQFRVCQPCRSSGSPDRK